MTTPDPKTYAAGWYPDVHAPGTERYYDGAQWTAHTRFVPAQALPLAAAQPAFPASGQGPVLPPKRNATKTGLIVAGSALAAVLFFGSIAAAVGSIADDVAGAPSPSPSASVPASEAAVEEEVVAEAPVVEEEPIVLIEVPDVVGLSAGEAERALTGAGLAVTYTGESDAKVVSTSPGAGSAIEADSKVSLVLEEKPAPTLAQKNALGAARNYLSFMGFSRSGLIEQLEFEGYSTDDASWAADNVDADWHEQAASTAANYLNTMAFSRDGLLEQLLFEGYSREEAESGLSAVGY